MPPCYRHVAPLEHKYARGVGLREPNPQNLGLNAGASLVGWVGEPNPYGWVGGPNPYEFNPAGAKTRVHLSRSNGLGNPTGYTNIAIPLGLNAAQFAVRHPS